MTTSIKIFIIALIGVPVSLFAYSALLKARYMAGNLKPEVNNVRRDDSKNYVDFKLPASKYIVVNGWIKYGNGGNYRISSWTTYPGVNIIGDSTKTPYAQVNKYYKSLYKTRVFNDTLFIDFYRDKPIGNINVATDNLLTLHLNNATRYIRAIANHMDVEGTLDPQYLKITTADRAKVNLVGLKVDQLDIIARDSCSFKLNHVQHTSILSYSLLGTSSIDFAFSPIKTFKPVRVDSAATMDVTVKGAAIQRYLVGGM